MCGLVIFLWYSAVVLKLVDFKTFKRSPGVCLSTGIYSSVVYLPQVSRKNLLPLLSSFFFLNISGVTYVDYRFIDLSTNKDIKIIFKNNQKVYSKCSDKN